MTDAAHRHVQIVRCILARRLDKAAMLLASHIEASKAVVRQITLHRLHCARSVARSAEAHEPQRKSA